MSSRLHIAAVLIGVLGCTHTPHSVAGAQDLRALARAHAAAKPGVPLHMTAGPGDYWPKDIGELAKESDVVLRGTLIRSGTYLGGNEDRILTDYRIQVQQLIAGKLPPTTRAVHDNVPPLLLTVYGGELKVEGVLVRAIDPNRADIVEGRSYLLFLMPSRRNEGAYYEVYYGGIFEVSENLVKPILRNGELIFKDIVGSRLEDLIVRIKSARNELP